MTGDFFYIVVRISSIYSAARTITTHRRPLFLLLGVGIVVYHHDHILLRSTSRLSTTAWYGRERRRAQAVARGEEASEDERTGEDSTSE